MLAVQPVPFFSKKMLLYSWQKSVWIFHPVCHWYNYMHGGSQFMSIFVLPYALLNTSKMLVTFSKGFQLSSAALKFSSWQHPPSHRFHEQWQWVYFLFYTQPFPELAVMGLTLLRDTVSQQNSSVQSSKHWVSIVVENVCLQKALLFFKKEKTTEQMLQSNKTSFSSIHLTYIFLSEAILSFGRWLSDLWGKDKEN